MGLRSFVELDRGDVSIIRPARLNALYAYRYAEPNILPVGNQGGECLLILYLSRCFTATYTQLWRGHNT